MKHDIRPGHFVSVKPSHRVDLDGDPPYGTVLAVYPTGKVRICWVNHGCRTHDLKSLYMDRFEVTGHAGTASFK